MALTSNNGEKCYCRACKQEKPPSRFNKDKNSETGRKDICIACQSIELAEKNKSKVVDRRRKRTLNEEVQKQTKKVSADAKAQKKRDELSAKKKADKAKEREELRQKALEIAKERRKKSSKANRAKTAEERRATAAERELAQRALCRRKLLPFIRKFNKSYEAGWVHRDICERLERFVKDVEDGKSPRLMLFMPPRHGKSEISSKNLPAWVLGKHPEWELIAASYAVSLPIGFSRKIQSMLEDPYYQILFPETKLHPKAQSAEYWMTDGYEGAYVASGTTGGITGKGAHILIIDDPVKDSEEADSDSQRDKVWDWWGSTAKTRLAPGGGVLVIQTRWHDDDLSGRLLLQMKELREEYEALKANVRDRMRMMDPESDEFAEAAEELELYEEEEKEIDQWQVVRYPAIAEEDEWRLNDEPGRPIVTTEELEQRYGNDVMLALLRAYGHPKAENYATESSPPHNPKFANLMAAEVSLMRRKNEALHEDRYPYGRLMNMKRSMQKRHWAALYQQNPVPDEGMYFTKDMVRYSASHPPLDEMYLFSAWDLAAGEKQQNDYIVGSVGGLDWQGNIHILDLIRFRSSDMFTVAERIMKIYKKYPQIRRIGVEKGALELTLMPQMRKVMRREKVYPTFDDTLKPISDKLIRARPLQGLMQNGMVTFPSNQPWVDVVLGEMLRFPGGTHDDIVDSLAWLARMMVKESEPPKPGSYQYQSWKEKLFKQLANQRAAGRGNYMGA